MSTQRPGALGTGRLVGWGVLVGVLAALNYAGNLAGGSEAPEDFIYRYSSAVAGVVQFGIMLGITLLIARGAPWRDTFALRAPISIPRAVGLGIGLIVVVYIVLGLLSPLLQPGEEQGLVPDFFDETRIPQFVANAAVIVLFAPIVEEFIYRGLGLTLLERFGRGRALFLVGLTFALGHGLLEALPVFTVFGAGLAYLRVRTASIYPCIAAHALFNGTALAAGILAS